MQTDWRELEEFPDYAISEFGEIINMKTGAPRKVSQNIQGVSKISLYRGRELHTRSIAVLVASKFLEAPEEPFDTIIHLDGDRQNCEANNLMWRPRWFAIKYHKQFLHDEFHDDKSHMVELTSGEHYYSLKEACVKNGLYYFDVMRSDVENTFVPITYQEFRTVRE